MGAMQIAIKHPPTDAALSEIRTHACRRIGVEIQIQDVPDFGLIAENGSAGIATLVA
jgi:hypothetical protein